MENVEEKIVEILCDLTGADAEDMEMGLELFEDGILDSFGVISLFVELEENFGIRVEPTEIEREEISTPAKIIAYVEERI